MLTGCFDSSNFFWLTKKRPLLANDCNRKIIAVVTLWQFSMRHFFSKNDYLCVFVQSKKAFLYTCFFFLFFWWKISTNKIQTDLHFPVCSIKFDWIYLLLIVRADVNRNSYSPRVKMPIILWHSSYWLIGWHIFVLSWRCPWCNGYHRRKIRRHEFKSWTRLIAFHIALIPLGKVWIQ